MTKEVLGRTKGIVFYGDCPYSDDVKEYDKRELKERVKYLEGRNKQLERENNRLTEKIKRYSCTIKTMLEVIKREEK